ncbi:DUF3800 domain-containing protein [Macrococcoides canis]|uniref:DUF3800 domain-containing protein n=1 Tax=Macrococcoides canis TaxID=1855823 RepID=UPI0020B7C44E|nr:DUF3800 domain-containing protein [Macrococcus canis]UTH00536.1 DUF3800 domain-containing protein [Macrococcus canis]
MLLTLYGDESGTITLCNDPKFKFFYIGMISTEEQKKVKRVFRNAKKAYCKQYRPNRNLTKEFKGSEMSAHMKRFIFEQLINKTDIKFHFIVSDNHHLRKVLREKPHITFNFLIGRFLKRNCCEEYTHITLVLDNRNKSVDNLKDLDHYLSTELIATTNIRSVNVLYVDSMQSDLVQIADVFNNLLYRYGNGKRIGESNKCTKEYNDNLATLKMLSNRIQYSLLFPRNNCDFEINY